MINGFVAKNVGINLERINRQIFSGKGLRKQERAGFGKNLLAKTGMVKAVCVEKNLLRIVCLGFFLKGLSQKENLSAILAM